MDAMGRAARAARQIEEWTAKRDTAIRDARSEGHSLREIAAVTGLSHVHVRRLTAKKEGQ